MLLRRSERVILGYFSYATAVAFVLPVSSEVRLRTVLVNLALAAVLAVLVRRDSRHARDWFALATMLLAYREMGWFALPHPDTRLEESWVVLDRIVLNDLGFRSAIEFFGPVLPFVLELSYLLVYVIGTFCVVLLYVSREQRKTETFLFPLLLGTFLSYVLFPFFPSEPPRTVFPNEDLPAYRPVIREFTHWLLGHYGIHTSVFPSAHVSSAFSAAFGMLPLTRNLPAVRYGLFLLASLIAVATVYGRYHYLVDAVAGLAVAVTAWAVTCWLNRRR